MAGLLPDQNFLTQDRLLLAPRSQRGRRRQVDEQHRSGLRQQALRGGVHCHRRVGTGWFGIRRILRLCLVLVPQQDLSLQLRAPFSMIKTTP